MSSGNEIRQQFIEFFVERCGHTAVPSAGLLPLDDSSLLFLNSGMAQFKDVFLGTGSRPYRRAVDSQKCIRISGKHNDLEEVGRDTYHHTFFEMLGNWSFGDYYKEEAILWAWELLTEVWGLDKRRLHATVFSGDEEYGLEADEEAEDLWRRVTDIDPTHVHRCGKEDNFWMMGETGPCGPCSEIHIDLTSDGTGGALVNAGDPRVMELWNLVFIQYDRTPKGQLELLPEKHVDTGMGFERIAAVLQGKSSNYDTDIFSPLMTAISELTGRTYGSSLDDLTDIAFRVIADHVRMITFAIADGARPGNKDQGYAVRRVLRRAARFAWQCFEQREPFLHRLVPVLSEHMGDAYPELREKPQRLAEIIAEEEASFQATIERGLWLFEKAARHAESGDGIVDGEAVFDLYSTYGFPPDLTQQMTLERGLSVDVESYESLMEDFRAAGRRASASSTGIQIRDLPQTDDCARWTGLTDKGRVLGWVVDDKVVQEGSVTSGQEDGTVALLLDSTCFYAESGGQIGDAGKIITDSGTFAVTDTVREGDAVLHWGTLQEGRIQVSQEAVLRVDRRRLLTSKNHTSTHLLHWALRQVLGDHVEQRGSRVKPDEASFDFSHGKPILDSELDQVQLLVNDKIAQDLPLEIREVPIAEARQIPGIRMFFGEKYGEVVRVVQIGDGFSTELCGGTHLERTGQAGFFKVQREEGIGKGLRRLTFVTAQEAVAAVNAMDAILRTASHRLSCQTQEIPARIEALQEELSRLHQHARTTATADLRSSADRLFSTAPSLDGVKVIVGEIPAAPAEQIRELIDRLRDQAGTTAVVLGWSNESKVQLIAGLTEDLLDRGLHAGRLVSRLAKVVEGTGGGRPLLAQAGGSQASKLPEALELARELIQKELAA